MESAKFLSTLSLRRATAGSFIEYIHNAISIHALLAESDAVTFYNATSNPAFLSTLSLRRATAEVIAPTVPPVDFYPRSPCGERPFSVAFVFGFGAFLSTLSLRRATELWKLLYPGRTNFYPRSPCGERQQAEQEPIENEVISIHALLAESDPPYLDTLVTTHVFLSTLSLRRATASAREGR